MMKEKKREVSKREWQREESQEDRDKGKTERGSIDRKKKKELIKSSVRHIPIMIFLLLILIMLINLQPELVEKLIIVDISPATSSPNLTSMPEIFQALETVNLPTDVSMSQARSSVDGQLSKSILDSSLRSFLLTNLIQKSNGRCKCDILRFVDLFYWFSLVATTGG